MLNLTYPVVIHKNRVTGHLGAHIPDVSGCFSHGETYEGLMANLKEALDFHLEGEDEIPEPSDLGLLKRTEDPCGRLIWGEVEYSR